MSIEKNLFGTTPCGQDVYEYTLTNSSGAKLQVLTYGLRIHKLWIQDKNGNLADVVLGYDKLEDYLGADFQGTFVGRYANRIGKAQFTLNGTTYELSKNDGENSLHGGPGGYHQVVWNVADEIDGTSPSIVFTHTSPDGDENYPGKLELKVTYTLTENNELKLDYEAVSDKETPFNPTNHSFFNLSGDHKKNVFNTELKLLASRFTPVEDDLIPTGEIATVNGTYLDFSAPKKLGKDMFADDHGIKLCGGFDHNFCVDGDGFRLHAEAYDEETGRAMQVYSDMPGIQLYTFNHAPEKIGKNGIPMSDHSAFCLETQYYPDSVNQPGFPFEFLQPGVPFKSTTVYKFSVK